MVLQMQEQFQRTVVGTVTTQFALTGGASLSVSGSIVSVATITGSVNISTTNTTIKTDTTQTTTTQTIQGQASQPIPPMTLMRGFYQMWPEEHEVDFSMSATINADLVPDNIPNKKHLSDIIPADKLSREIKGTITVTQVARSSQADFPTSPLTEAACQAIRAQYGTADYTSKGVIEKKGALQVR
jgi:hypothetical protein